MVCRFSLTALTINTIGMHIAVRNSDKHNDSQIPFSPIALGSSRNGGIRKMKLRNRASAVAGFTLSTL